MTDARSFLEGIVRDLDLLAKICAVAPTGISESVLGCIERIAADRHALIRLLDELEVQPDQLGRYGSTDRDFNGWAGKPVAALRAHLGLGEDPGDERRHENYSQREKRILRENYERSSEHAQAMADAWIAEYERRKKAGL